MDAWDSRRGTRKLDTHAPTFASRWGDAPAVSHSTMSRAAGHLQPDHVPPSVAFESQAVREATVPGSRTTLWVHDGRRGTGST